MSRLPELVAVVKRLRGPDGCPWDREQTAESLRPCLIEEAYEVLDAIGAPDPAELRDELGDLLLQIVLHAELASERGRFSIDDVIAAIIDKMIRRHPHVFGDAVVADSAEVLRNWVRIKHAEHAAAHPSDTSVLGALPSALPALHAACRTGEKASRVGFDWPSARDALGKVREEVAELEEALASGVPARVEHELGDALFALASVGRLAGQDAEMALRAALARFQERFRAVEALLRAQDRDIHATSPAELEALWRQVKDAERR
jgi:nucleoside triphosphate diphosphatase